MSALRPKSYTKPDLLKAFQAEAAGRFAGEPDWLKSYRQAHINTFERLGVPTPANEEWVFTNLKSWAETSLHPVTALTITPAQLREQLLYLFDLPDGPRLFFIDGQFYEPLSTKSADLPRGIEMKTLEQAIAEDHPVLRRHLEKDNMETGDGLPHLTAALASSGLFLHIQKEAHTYVPIVLAHISTAQNAPQEISIRNLIVAEEGALALVIEVFMGLEQSQASTQVLSDFKLGEKARLEHIKIHKERAQSFHLAKSYVEQAAGSYFESFTLSYGGKISRLETNVTLTGDATATKIEGTLLLKDNRHGDATTRITHKGQACTSEQMWKMILADQARGVFQGKTVVEKNAQKTDGYQLNQTLLLSDRAQIDSKPELEIYADDVKCSHGATTGNLDEEALFYLKSRGIEESQAKQLLVEAFVGEAINKISHEPMREHLHKAVSLWLKDLQP